MISNFQFPKKVISVNYLLEKLVLQHHVLLVRIDLSYTHAKISGYFFLPESSYQGFGVFQFSFPPFWIAIRVYKGVHSVEIIRVGLQAV